MEQSEQLKRGSLDIDREIKAALELLKLDNAAAAINNLENIAHREQNSARVYFALGQMYRSAFLLDKAKASTIKALQIDPENQFGYHELGLTAIASGDWSEALSIYMNGCYKVPSRLNRIMVAECLLNLGAYLDAWDLFELEAKEQPADTHITRRLLTICACLEQYEVAIDVANEALLYNDDAGIRTTLAEAYARINCFEQALNAAELVKQSGRGDIYIDNRITDYKRQLSFQHASLDSDSLPHRLPESRARIEHAHFRSQCAITYNSRSPNDTEYSRKSAIAFASLGRHKEAAFSYAKMYSTIKDPNGKSAMSFVASLVFSGFCKVGTIPNLKKSCGNRKSDIPGTIIQFWDKDPLPDLEATIQRWIDINPQWKHYLFSEETARIFILENYGEVVRDIFDYAHHPAMKADIFRLLYIKKFGGIYVDADDVCRVPLEKWLANEDIGLIVSMAPAPTTYIHNWFIAARPNHEVINLATSIMLADMTRYMTKGTKPPIWEVTGPGCLTRALLQYATDTLLNNSGVASSTDIMIVGEQVYRSLISWKTDLAYRSQPGKDWRFI